MIGTFLLWIGISFGMIGFAHFMHPAETYKDYCIEHSLEWKVPLNITNTNNIIYKCDRGCVKTNKIK